MNRITKWIVLSAVLTALLLLTGCTLGNSVESLFTLPQLPEEYQELSDTLEQMLDAGYSYVTPTEGTNIESVQMVDLDGDTVKEAVALLQHNGEKKPIKIMVFRQNGDHFDDICTVESSRAEIGSISYHDLTDDGVAELLVSWQGEDEKKTLAVYRIDDASHPLLEEEYTEYILQDLTGGEQSGLVLLRENSYHESFAEYYTWQMDRLNLASSCAIGSSMASVLRGSVVSGFLADGTPAVFITGVQGGNLATTDVVMYSGGGLINVVWGSAPYRCCQLAPQDINGDGITEVPRCESDPDEEDTAAVKDTLVSWFCYDCFGGSKKVAETYHCQSYGWYLLWPEEYWGSISSSNSDTFNGENCVEFSVQGQPAVNIYSITCENRESRAQMDARFILTRLPDTIYAAELSDQLSPDGLTVDTIRSHFSLIVDTWDSGREE